MLTPTLQAMGAVLGLESGEFLLRAGDVVETIRIAGSAGVARLQRRARPAWPCATACWWRPTPPSAST